MVSEIVMDKSERPFCCSFLVSPNPQIDTGYLTHANNPKTRNLQHTLYWTVLEKSLLDELGRPPPRGG